MNNHSTKSEPITPERIAKAAGVLAYMVERYGPIHREMFIQFMQQYRTALKFEDDFPLALSWHKNGYRKEDIPLETKPPAATEMSRLLTMQATAAYVGVSVPTFTKWVDAGLFPRSVSITKMWDRKAIDAQLDKLSGLETRSVEDDGGYERRRLEREAKKAARRGPHGKPMGVREKQALRRYYKIRGPVDLDVKGCGYVTLKGLLARGYVVSVDPDPKNPMPICKITPEGEAAWLAIADRDGIDF